MNYPDGLKGVNCRHDFHGVDPDFMPPAYTAEELAEMEARENKKHPFEATDRHGNKIIKEFTPYEATQEMRRMETVMRKQRSLAAGFKAGGNMDDYHAAKGKYQTQQDEYKRFCGEMGMKMDLTSRVFVDGLGKV